MMETTEIYRWAVVGPSGIKPYTEHGTKEGSIDAFRLAATHFMAGAAPEFSFYESMGYRVAKFKLVECAEESEKEL